MTRSLARILAVVLVLLVWVVPASALGAPEDPGPYDVDKTERAFSVGNDTVTFDLYLANGVSTPEPIVVFGHGFARSRANMADWAEQAAKRGFVAAAPNFPGPIPNHDKNGEVLRSLAEHLATLGQDPTSPIFGRVDPKRRAVVGHSAGGLAAALAASGAPEIGLAILLDPVDASEKGKAAAPNIVAPVVSIFADAGTCNAQGNGRAVFAAAPGPKVSLDVIGATHCDGESPSGFLCTTQCGASTPARHTTFRRYAFAALDGILRCDPAAWPYLGGAGAQGDSAVTAIDVQGALSASALGCSNADGGVPRGPSAGDGGSTGGRCGAPTAAGEDAGAAGAAASDSGGCGCTIARAMPDAPARTMVVVVGLALLFGWRRRP